MSWDTQRQLGGSWAGDNLGSGCAEGGEGTGTRSPTCLAFGPRSPHHPALRDGPRGVPQQLCLGCPPTPTPALQIIPTLQSCVVFSHGSVPRYKHPLHLRLPACLPLPGRSGRALFTLRLRGVYKPLRVLQQKALTSVLTVLRGSLLQNPCRSVTGASLIPFLPPLPDCGDCKGGDHVPGSAQHLAHGKQMFGFWWKAPVSSETVSFLVSLLVPGLWLLLRL